MKIFLDVGAYHGLSAKAATDQRFSFDRIICFEPSSECIPYIEAINDKRIHILPFGMWNETTTKILYGSGHYGASIFRDKPITGTGLGINASHIKLIKASKWVNENIRQDDIVFMKLNCEGCECDIVDDLIINNQISKLYNIMIDFDAGKIPSIQHREIETRKLLRARRIYNVCFSEDVMIGDSHEARIHHWLDLVGAAESLPLNMLRKRYGKKLRDLSTKRYLIRIIEVYLKTKYRDTSIYSLLKYAKRGFNTISSKLCQ